MNENTKPDLRGKRGPDKTKRKLNPNWKPGRKSEDKVTQSFTIARDVKEGISQHFKGQSSAMVEKFFRSKIKAAKKA